MRGTSASAITLYEAMGSPVAVACLNFYKFIPFYLICIILFSFNQDKETSNLYCNHFNWWESDPKPLVYPTSSYSVTDRQVYTEKKVGYTKRKRKWATQKNPRVECREAPWEIRQVLLLLSSGCAIPFYRRNTGQRGRGSRIGRWVSNHVDQNYE